MTRHLLKIVWHRKRANALVMAEIFFSFLVVFAVLTAVIAIVSRWNDPLGFSWNDVWVIRFDGDGPSGDQEAFRETVPKLLTELKRFPEVMDAAASMAPPYGNSTSIGTWNIDGRRIEMLRDEVTDSYANTMGIKVLRGRWFGPQDDGSAVRPVVIGTTLAKQVFGDADPIGRKFDADGDHVTRVIGVVPSYRKDGELSLASMDIAFFRVPTVNPEYMPRHIVVHVRPGTPAQFEETLTKRLHAAAPTFPFRVRRMDAMRTLSLRMRLAPVVILGIVALFLITMVALGLTGVLWQSVTRRTRELGLRRALGATGPNVRSQVLFEVALLSTLAVAAGVVIVLQLPILGILRFVSVNVFAAGVAAALVVIYAITLLCAAYPSWLASSIEPAEALRYE